MQVSEPGFLVCGDYNLSGYHCDGSVMTNCCKCDTPLWIAPTGLELLAQHAVQPICKRCAKGEIIAGKEKGIPIEFEDLNPDQIKEMRKHMSLEEVSGLRKEVEEELGI